VLILCFQLQNHLRLKGVFCPGRVLARKKGVWDGTSSWDFNKIELKKLKNMTQEMWESIPRLSSRFQKIDASHQRDVNTLLPSLKGLVRIEHLNLARSNLTDKGLLEFAKNTNADIEILDTRWTRVTDSGLERFRERHPTTVFPLVGGKIDYPFLGVISENAEINDNVKVSQLMRQTASDKNH
jgi:hypothetical protein